MQGHSAGGEGAEVVYSLRNSDKLAKLILDSIGSEGQLMRKYYQRRLPTDPSKDYYFIQRLTGNTQALLIEYGFIDNSKDLKKLENNLLTYGEAVVRAIAEYTNTPYVSPEDIGSNVYVVQRGDTLYSIANKFNVTVAELKAANKLTSNLLNVGQRLTIPTTSPGPEESAEYIIYEVKRGDSLYSIAEEFNLTVNDLINFNQLASTNLSIGQKILIPINSQDKPSSTEDEYYTVVKGDSLYNIAKKFNTTVDEIIKNNNLTSTVLQVGDKLLIFKGQATTPSETPPSSEDQNIYVVQSGDSLYSIAKKFNTTVQEIKNLNNLTSNLLSIGQTLKVPTQDSYPIYYVKSGDSLYSIARKYNTSVADIKRLNNLTSDVLSIGQALQIPSR